MCYLRLTVRLLQLFSLYEMMWCFMIEVFSKRGLKHQAKLLHVSTDTALY